MGAGYKNNPMKKTKKVMNKKKKKKTYITD